VRFSCAFSGNTKSETNVPVVEKIKENLYRVTIVANKGLLPTYTEIGDKIRFVSKMKTEIQLKKINLWFLAGNILFVIVCKLMNQMNIHG
jgi:hypothetical protein